MSSILMQNNQNNNQSVVAQDMFIHENDESLRNMENGLRAKIERMKPSKVRVELEVKLCYIQREIQLRRARGEAHAEYLKNLKR
jgi:hypothetical protein